LSGKRLIKILTNPAALIRVQTWNTLPFSRWNNSGYFRITLHQNDFCAALNFLKKFSQINPSNTEVDSS